MTLILCLGNREQFIQLSDRRLTADGKFLDDETNKSGVLQCVNARFAFGFTGIAKAGKAFNTNEWLLEKIIESSQAENRADQIMLRLKEKINNEFYSLPSLSKIPISQKALSIIFTGYLYNFDPPRGVCAILSNTNNQNSVQEKFNFTIKNQKIGKADLNFSFIEYVGYIKAMKNEDLKILKDMLITNKPSQAIVNKAVLLIKQIADRPQAHEAIGKQISSIVIPRDLSKTAKTGYHSEILSRKYFMPYSVFALQNHYSAAIRDITIEAMDVNAPPLVYPKWPKNRKCPCGSGKKYKYCHGK